MGQLNGDFAKGWNFVPSTAARENALVYVNPNPAKFMLRRGLLPLRIHPEDMRYGFRVHGVVLEPVDGLLTMRNWERVFTNLKIDPDGYVRITFNITSLAGVETRVTIALEVTPEAVRRGTNVDYYIQRKFCGSCGSDTLEKDAKRFYETGELDPLDQFEEACRKPKERIELKKPFAREAGFAYLAAVPELAESADGPNASHRSPFFLCEGRIALSGSHSRTITSGAMAEGNTPIGASIFTSLRRMVRTQIQMGANTSSYGNRAPQNPETFMVLRTDLSALTRDCVIRNGALRIGADIVVRTSSTLN